MNKWVGNGEGTLWSLVANNGRVITNITLTERGLWKTSAPAGKEEFIDVKAAMRHVEERIAVYEEQLQRVKEYRSEKEKIEIKAENDRIKWSNEALKGRIKTLKAVSLGELFIILFLMFLLAAECAA